jgi:hypothetical protein
MAWFSGKTESVVKYLVFWGLLLFVVLSFVGSPTYVFVSPLSALGWFVIGDRCSLMMFAVVSVGLILSGMYQYVVAKAVFTYLHQRKTGAFKKR